MNTHFTIREYWFTPKNQLKVEELPDWTKKLQNAYKAPNDPEKVHVFAKPVFKTSFAGSTGPDNSSKWEIRLIDARREQNQPNSKQKNTGKQKSSSPDSFEFSISTSNGGTKSGGSSKLTVETVPYRVVESLEVYLTSKIANLISVIEETKKLVIMNSWRLEKAEAIERKLSKLIVYLLKTVNKSPALWPYEKPKSTGEPSSIEEMEKAFKKFNALFDPQVYITEDNQDEFSSYLSKLNHAFLETAMTIEEISWKITSKSKRSSHQGRGWFERVQELLQIGVEYIVWKDEKLRREDLRCLLQSLKENAFTYQSDADFALSKKKFQEVVDDIIERIMCFENKPQNHTILCDFCLSLFNEIHSYLTPTDSSLTGNLFGGEAQPGLATNVDLSSLFSLAWMLEALVNHQPKKGSIQEPFIRYMRRPECVAKVTPVMQKKIVDLFFPPKGQSESSVWMPVADFIIGLGQKELINALIEKGITQANTVTRNQIDHIFHSLNHYLSVEKGQRKKDYRDMFDKFIAKLAGFNKLHFLKPYARKNEHQTLLRDNLKDPNPGGADYSFMQGIPDLSSFFGNATFAALKGVRDIEFGPPREDLKRTLVRLFRGYGNHKVGHRDTLITELRKFTRDYLEGYEDLFIDILGQLGDMSESKDYSIVVEDWIKGTLTDLYRSIKNYVIMSIPLDWEEHAVADLSSEDLCFHEDKLYVMRQGADGTLALQEWLTGSPPPQTPTNVLATEGLDSIKVKLSANLRENSGSPRQQVSALAAAYFRFPKVEKFKDSLKMFEALLFDKMKKEGSKSGTFEGRLKIWVEFFQAISPFFNHLERQIGERFFVNGKLKLQVVKELIAKYQKLKVQKVDSTKYTHFVSMADTTIEPKTPQLIELLATLVAPLCEEEVKQVLEGSNLSDLGEIAKEFDAVVRRKLDDLSFTNEEVIHAFGAYKINQESYAGFKRTNTLKEAVGNLAIKEQLFADHKSALVVRKPPINYILPNQAIAAELCTSPAFRFLNGKDGTETNLLIKLGTGQGKSLIIAKAALNEAMKFNAENRKGLVLVVTSYPHLAKRDQELGQSFFGNQFRSVCLSKFEDVEGAFRTDPHIVYTDMRSLEKIVRDAAIYIFSGEGKKEHKDFIKAIFGIDRKLRLILDEFDLLIEDYRGALPYVQNIPNTLLNKAQLQSLKGYNEIGGTPTNLEMESEQDAEANQGGADGLVSWEATPYEDGEFVFPIAVLRLLQLMDDAERIIGLSGTSDAGTEKDMKNRFYFEIPSSFDLNKFGTDYDKDKTIQNTNPSRIVCRDMQELAPPRKDRPKDKYYLIDENTLQNYLKAIIADVKAVQSEETESSKKRPVLIFADPLLKFKHEHSAKETKLWDVLQQALKDEGIVINPLSDTFEKEATASDRYKITDSDLQTIGLAGKVTISHIKWARGSDIRVHPDIEKGLHVLIATPLLNDRVLSQTVGRTGRMGHPGSYSAITMGRLIPAPADVLRSEASKKWMERFLKAYHEMTKLFMKEIIDSGDSKERKLELCRKWLIFTAAAWYSYKYQINKSHAKEICKITDQKIRDLGIDEFFK